MINRLFRFHGHNSLLPVYRKGTTVRGNLMSLKFAARKPGSTYRAAVVVSKKVHKSAVVRNRIRRRVFELIRSEQTSLGSNDIVVTVFSEQAATIPAPQLKEQVLSLLTKINSSTPDATTGNHGIVKTKRI